MKDHYTPPNSRYGGNRKDDIKKYEEEINNRAKNISSFTKEEKKDFKDLVLEYYACCKYNVLITYKREKKKKQNLFIEMQYILLNKLPGLIDSYDPNVKEFTGYLNCCLYHDVKKVKREYWHTGISSLEEDYTVVSSGLTVPSSFIKKYDKLKKYAKSKGIDLSDPSQYQQIAKALGLKVSTVEKIIEAERGTHRVILSTGSDENKDTINPDPFDNIPDLGPSPEEVIDNTDSLEEIAMVTGGIIGGNTGTQYKVITQKLTQIFAIYAPDKITQSIKDGKFFSFDKVLADNIIKAREVLEAGCMAKGEKDLCAKLKAQFTDKSLASKIGISPQQFSRVWKAFTESLGTDIFKQIYLVED